jgi:hypothetical protein
VKPDLAFEISRLTYHPHDERIESAVAENWTRLNVGRTPTIVILSRPIWLVKAAIGQADRIRE